MRLIAQTTGSCILVRDSAMAAHNHSRIIPAIELQAEMRKERQAQSVQVDKPAANCLNPDTTTGAIFGEQLLEKLQGKMELQATRAADAVSKKHERCGKKLEETIQRRQQTKEYLEKNPCNNWRGLSIKALQVLWIVLVRETLPAGASAAIPTEKETFTAALAVVIANHRATGVEIALEGGLEDDEPCEDIPETN